jgi:hypothetical protein
MEIKEILIWIFAIIIALFLWPLALTMLTFTFYILMTVGLVIGIAWCIRRIIDGYDK